MDVEDDGAPEARLDAIEAVLGMVVMHMPKDASRIMLADLRRVAGRAEAKPDIPEDSIRALRRLHDLLQRWRDQVPGTLRPRPVGTPPSGDGA